jgi:mRNA deadenylase 3'-5' endonuclease subunit Ccr4
MDCCDYIFFGCTPSSGACAVEATAVLLPPDAASVPLGLPTAGLGSDHVCLVSRFSVTMNLQPKL